MHALILAGLLVAVSPALAQSDAAACREIQDSLVRLRCYDDVTKPGASTSKPTAPAPAIPSDRKSEVGWHYNGEAGWNLAFYGIPESDALSLSIRCERPGTLFLNLALAHGEIGARKHGQPVKVPLLLDLPDGERQTVVVQGKVEKDDDRGDTVYATVSARHALITALREGRASTLGTAATWIPLKGAAEVTKTLLERCR